MMKIGDNDDYIHYVHVKVLMGFGHNRMEKSMNMKIMLLLVHPSG